MANFQPFLLDLSNNITNDDKLPEMKFLLQEILLPAELERCTRAHDIFSKLSSRLLIGTNNLEGLKALFRHMSLENLVNKTEKFQATVQNQGTTTSPKDYKILEISPFIVFLNKLCDDLTSDNLADMKYLIGNKVAAGILQQCKKPRDIISTLLRRREISEHNLTYLEELLGNLGLQDLKRKVHLFVSRGSLSTNGSSRTGPEHPPRNINYEPTGAENIQMAVISEGKRPRSSDRLLMENQPSIDTTDAGNGEVPSQNDDQHRDTGVSQSENNGTGAPTENLTLQDAMDDNDIPGFTVPDRDELVQNVSCAAGRRKKKKLRESIYVILQVEEGSKNQTIGTACIVRVIKEKSNECKYFLLTHHEVVRDLSKDHLWVEWVERHCSGLVSRKLRKKLTGQIIRPRDQEFKTYSLKSNLPICLIPFYIEQRSFLDLNLDYIETDGEEGNTLKFRSYTVRAKDFVTICLKRDNENRWQPGEHEITPQKHNDTEHARLRGAPVVMEDQQGDSTVVGVMGSHHLPIPFASVPPIGPEHPPRNINYEPTGAENIQMAVIGEGERPRSSDCLLMENQSSIDTTDAGNGENPEQNQQQPSGVALGNGINSRRLTVSLTLEDVYNEVDQRFEFDQLPENATANNVSMWNKERKKEKLRKATFVIRKEVSEEVIGAACAIRVKGKAKGKCKYFLLTHEQVVDNLSKESEDTLHTVRHCKRICFPQDHSRKIDKNLKRFVLQDKVCMISLQEAPRHYLDLDPLKIKQELAKNENKIRTRTSKINASKFRSYSIRAKDFVKIHLEHDENGLLKRTRITPQKHSDTEETRFLGAPVVVKSQGEDAFVVGIMGRNFNPIPFYDSEPSV